MLLTLPNDRALMWPSVSNANMYSCTRALLTELALWCLWNKCGQRLPHHSSSLPRQAASLYLKKKKKSGAGGGKQTTCNYPIQPMHHFLPCWRSKRASVSVATLLPGDSCGFGWVDVSELTERDTGEPRMALVKCSTQCVVVVQMLKNTCGLYWFTSVFIQCHHVYMHVYMYFYFHQHHDLQMCSSIYHLYATLNSRHFFFSQ